MTTFNNDSLKHELASEFIRRNDLVARWGLTISSFLAIPGLVGFWPMSSVQRSTGNVYDLSGQGRTLTYNGNPTFDVHNQFVPYIDMDGSGDFLSRADETDLDIIGSETIFPSGQRGLTVGGWFKSDSLAAFETLISKWGDPGNQKSYILQVASGVPLFGISTDGSAASTVSHVSISTNTWYFIVGRFVPNTFFSVYVNATGSHQATTIATLFNGTAAFQIGTHNSGTSILGGSASLCFLSAKSLSETLITMLFQQSRVLFGI